MRRADQIRLRHMPDGAAEALSFAEGKRREDLAEDRLLVLVKAIEIIGEAADQVSADTRESLPGLPWEDIIGMRHRLVHAYFDINLDVLWRTVRDDLPSLVAPLEKALKEATSGF